MSKTNYEYDIALSFAGENRDYVENVVQYLKERNVRFFYDKYEEADLWGKDLYVHLDKIYQKKAKYCVMFLSRYYAEKVWTNHERESAQARAFQEKEEYILPARFDDTEIPGIRPITGYVDLRTKTPEEFARLIIKKIDKKAYAYEKVESEPFRKPKIKNNSFNPYDESQQFISYVAEELKKRGDSIDGITTSVFNREGKTCIRIVHDGKTKYSLDIWMGGMLGDSSISFYGIPGEPSYSSGATNAWGHIVWDREKESLALSFQDISLLQSFKMEEQIYNYNDFIDALWNNICDLLESQH